MRVGKAGIRLLCDDCRDTIAEFAEFDRICIFLSTVLLVGLGMIKDVHFKNPTLLICEELFTNTKPNLRGWRDGAMLGLLLGCGLHRSEVVGLNLDQLQSREGRWVIVNLVGKGKTATNGACAVVEQGASQCLAPAFGSERGKSIQAGFEGGECDKKLA
jgi:hypothetical protein